MVEQIVESWINSRIQVKICDTMFLHSKEEWIITISTRLQKTESIYNKEQNAITLNWGGYWQVKKRVVL